MPTPTPTAAPTSAKATASRPARGKPGGGRPRQKSRYGTQMAEKQNLKRIFGIRETQLKRYYSEAHRSKTQTGSLLISLLERRLDNAVYRAGFAPTRSAARQLATHRFFAVNGRPVDVPSYRLKPDDMVTVRENKRQKSPLSNFAKRMQNVHPPSWIVLDVDNFGFRVTGTPEAEESNLGVDVQAIVEFFAR